MSNVHIPLDEVTLIKQKSEEDTRYSFFAYLFVMHALQSAVGNLDEHRHITGRELLESIRMYGLELFGPLTQHVLAKWGVKTTHDFGNIVFNLVDVKVLGKKPEDSIEDFEDVYDFGEAFDNSAIIYPEELSIDHFDNF